MPLYHWPLESLGQTLGSYLVIVSWDSELTVPSTLRCTTITWSLWAQQRLQVGQVQGPTAMKALPEHPKGTEQDSRVQKVITTGCGGTHL